ncbi:MAG: UDP-N-acetylmuramoyl-L-alanine--D-glutamate ligase [Ruminococcaceae bacterium]|nr:UDP-N-acetylmuramoyl-L-alanine--D-glutamate ligase [Oscillospiraceae bacterium]
MKLTFKDKKVAVIGMGISNIPLIEYLLKEGAIVTGRDRKELSLMGDNVLCLQDKGVRLICGEDYLKNIDEEYIFRTPGMRYDTPELAEAVDKGAVLTSEMELFFERCPAKMIAVTGSDGKTTTTTLISKMIEKKFGKVYVGGNIGAPLLPYVDEMTEDDWAVLELSSFQLHTMKKSPHRAVITNLSPNHLDYHTDMQEYVDAKKNIFLHMTSDESNKLILNYANEPTRALAYDAVAGTSVIFFGYEGMVYEKDGAIWYGDEKVVDTADILIPGHHNVENYMAAIAAVYDIVGKDIIVDLAKTFGGVEHRIELVRVKDGVRYYNSSIDSSPSRTAAALASFDEKVIAICGGKDKGVPFDGLASTLCKGAKKVVLTGATRETIYNALMSCPEYKEGYPEIKVEPEFEAAVRAASDWADEGDVVILSPGCTSFDAFPNFMARGNKFKEIVKSL